MNGCLFVLVALNSIQPIIIPDWSRNYSSKYFLAVVISCRYFIFLLIVIGSTNKESKRPPEVSPQVERRPLSKCDSPVFLTDDDEDDDEDSVTITSTWRTRHTKPSSVTPRSVAAPVPSSAPPKSSQTKRNGWISSDEEEVESLLDRLKKNLRINSDRAQTPKNKPGVYFFLQC